MTEPVTQAPRSQQQPDAPGFVHLHVHSQYSLLSATSRVPDLVSAAAADQQPALALTDSGNLFAAVEFFKACRAQEIRPILGMEAFAAARSRLEPSGSDNPTHQLTLLVENQRGWENLKALSSSAYLEGFHYRPRIDRELLDRYREGLVVLSGSLSGEIPQHILKGDRVGAARVAGELRDMLGDDNFFLEVLETGYEPQKRLTETTVAIGTELGIDVVATNDVHYLNQQDWVAHDIMLCIRNGKTVADRERFRMGARELHFKTRAEMANAFAELPAALSNTIAIAERCHLEMDFGTYHLPVFNTGSDDSPNEAFEKLCHEGIRSRYPQATPEIHKRLEYEMGVIREHGFVSYFLIVADFLREARKLGIPVGPGRGSVAGSIIAYALYITDVDPIRYGLIFERFLNAARISMPDIDIDFCGDRRDEVIEYVRRKYGEENVCQIITFGTMASRGVLRDVGRVLQIPLSDIDRIAKKVPQGPGASLRKALETDRELQETRDESPENRRLFDLGLSLEGLVRHASVHAAGLVIADRRLNEYVPLCRNGEELVTQWQMTDLEEVGLLKMDFLGLKTLTILQEAVRLISEVHDADIDLDSLPLEDAPAYDLMTRGETQGVFQLESVGMRDLLARLRPDSFLDVIAVLALYRPGPLGSGMVDMFVRRKHGEEEVSYPHLNLKPILEESYGVILYQEQVMRIANVIGGFSMNDADSLRKAMGKKKPEVMAEFKDQFINGAITGGYERSMAVQTFETMEYFAGYGFNKSHSTAYALLTYRTAFLKAHYPVEFLAANLTVESSNSDKVKEFVDEARRMGTTILPPDLNRSLRNFSVEDGSIRFGLAALKGMGARAADLVVEMRGSGPYAGFEDFCERVDATLVNKTALEALVKGGAFETLGGTRRALFENIELAMRASAQTREDRRRGQGILFDAAPPLAAVTAAETAEEWPELERLAREKEALGFYLSGHPFEKQGRLLACIAGTTSSQVATLEAGTEVRVAGMVSGLRLIQIRSGRNAGQKMARFQLEDLDGSLQVTCFSRAYQQFKDVIQEDAIVFVKGRVDGSDEPTLLCDGVESAATAAQREVGEVILQLDGYRAHDEALSRIAEVLERHRGDQRFIIEIREGDQAYRIRTDRRFSVRISEELIDHLADIAGPSSLSFTRP